MRGDGIHSGKDEVRGGQRTQSRCKERWEVHRGTRSLERWEDAWHEMQGGVVHRKGWEWGREERGTRGATGACSELL